jgi:hypothetical protein
MWQQVPADRSSATGEKNPHRHRSLQEIHAEANMVEPPEMATQGDPCRLISFWPIHPEAKSFNAHLAQVARRLLETRGWSVSVSDLYGMGFDPCERAAHYVARQQPGRFDVQAEQRHGHDP